jgi:hypothetical protein
MIVRPHAVFSAEIIPFPQARTQGNRLTARDRIEALRWMDSSGYTRISFDSSGAWGNPELGDFLLIYRRNAGWSSWAVGCCDGGFTVWRPATGATVGWFPRIKDALASIPPAE